jgi:hypothetical protein
LSEEHKHLAEKEKTDIMINDENILSFINEK